MIPSNKGLKSRIISASAPHDLKMSPHLQLRVRIAVAAKPAKNPLMPSAQTCPCEPRRVQNEIEEETGTENIKTPS